MRQHVSILLCAMSGCGKSYLASYLISEIKLPRKWIIDIQDEYFLPDFHIFYVDVNNYHTIPDVIQKYNNIIFKIFLSDNNKAKVVDYICALAFLMKNTFLAFEECHVYIHKEKPLPNIRLVATAGRKYGVNSLFITQRPALLNTTIRSQTNVKICGRLSDGSDYEALKKYFINHELLLSLRPRVFLYHSIDGKEYLFSTDNLNCVHNG